MWCAGVTRLNSRRWLSEYAWDGGDLAIQMMGSFWRCHQKWLDIRRKFNRNQLNILSREMARNHEVGSGSKYLRQRLFLLPFLLQIMNYHEVLANGINLWRRVTTKEAAESIAALPSQPSNVESSWKFTIQTGSFFIQNGAQTSRWIILMITGRFISGRSIGFYQFLNMFPFFW